MCDHTGTQLSVPRVTVHTVTCATCDHTGTQLHGPHVTIQTHSCVPHVTVQEHSCVSLVWPYRHTVACATCDRAGTQLHVPRVTVQAHSWVTHVWPCRHTVVWPTCDRIDTQLRVPCVTIQAHSCICYVWLYRHTVICWCVPTYSKFSHALQALIIIWNNRKNKNRVSPNNIYFNFVLLLHFCCPFILTKSLLMLNDFFTTLCFPTRKKIFSLK